MTYYTGYPTEPIGGGNPYYRCQLCGVSDPEINGRLDGHRSWCPWRMVQEHKLEITVPGVTATTVTLKGDNLEDLEEFKRFFLRRKPHTFFDALEEVNDWGQSSTCTPVAIDNLFQIDGKHVVQFEY